ncbi:hypothetical protein IAU59_002584 [Kwoniella sp. CBS 9459]
MAPICFSPLTTVRCYGDDWSRLQHVVAYIPSGSEVLVLFALAAITYTRPNATSMFLALEVLVNLSLSTWSFAIQLDPPGVGIFKSNDTALTILSPIPLLLFQIFLTSHLLHRRTNLPRRCQSRRSTILFSALVAPLVPLSFVAGLLPVFFTSALRYTSGSPLSDLESGKESVNVRYGSQMDVMWAKVIAIVGAACGMAYIVLGMVAIIAHRRSTTAARGQRHHERPSQSQGPWADRFLSLGLLVATVELGLSMVDPSFALILVRRALLLMSRVFLSAGLFMIARRSSNMPLSEPSDVRGTTKNKNPADYSQDSESKRSRSRSRKATTKDTIATFGTPSSILAYHLGNQPQLSIPMTNPDGNWMERRPTTRGRWSRKDHSRTRSKSKSNPAQLVIGIPVKGSFKKLQSGLGDGTNDCRDWYDFNPAKFGIGIIGAQMSGFGSPARYDLQRQQTGKGNLKPYGNNIVGGRLPEVAIRDSTFTASSLDKLVSTLRQSVQLSGVINKNDDAYRPIFNADANAKAREGIPHEYPQSYSAGLRSTSSATVKKNVGSIYDPERISVDESELAKWPPSPPDAQIPRGGPMHPIIPMGNQQNIKGVPLVSQLRGNDATNGNVGAKRGNSIKRKPVPDLVSPSPSQALLPLTDDNHRQVRVSTYFTSRIPLRDDTGTRTSAGQYENDHQPQIQRTGGPHGVELRGGRKRAGTDIERGMWYGPVSQRESNARSTIYSAASEYNESSQVTDGHIEDRDRPSLGRRRSTDPTLAILAPLDFPLPPPHAQESYETARSTNTRTSRHDAARSMVSPTSLYSHLEADETTCPCGDGRSKLFYLTPVQSPELDQQSMIKFQSSLEGADEDPFRSFEETIRFTPRSEAGDQARIEPHPRQSELQRVLARLTRIQRETGIDMDYFETTSNDDQAEIYDYFDRRRRRKDGSENRETWTSISTTTIDSVLGSEDLTPVAGVYASQSFEPRT